MRQIWQFIKLEKSLTGANGTLLPTFSEVLHAASNAERFPDCGAGTLPPVFLEK